MKNKIFILLILVLFFHPLMAENLNIKSTNITIDKNTKLTIFKNSVVATDPENNILKTDYAEYKKDLKLLKSKGKTTILTSEGYFLTGKDITFDKKNNLIKSNEAATIKDLENNNIFLEKFEYSTKEKLFKSIGKIKVVDNKSNTYNFSQIYIDEKKKEIVGSNTKVFLNQESFKINKENKPRVFANTVKIDEKQNQFTKSIFTICDYRKNDKCPPWSIQSSKMTHDKLSKTIYYENAVLKVYDIPIFYFPKLSHPDPSVDRRSGFLPPSFSDSKNLGAGFAIPYYWALNNEKDFTLTSRLFSSEHPLFLGEYRHAFRNSNLILDFGFSEGYKSTSQNKTAGSKSHFFGNFVKNFKGDYKSENNLELSFQSVSNDKYLKLYKVKTDLVQNEADTLESFFNFTHENEDLFLGFQTSVFETLKDGYNDKYEYILPDIVIDKNLFSNNKYGNADFRTNLKVHNYDTNKYTKFFINDIDWKYKSFNFSSGLEGKILGKLKNVNYEAKNTDKYKKDTTHELFGALGYLSEIELYKKTAKQRNHLLTPKALIRYAPGHMRREDNGARLNHLNVFGLDRLNTNNNFESGLSTTVGFDYKMTNPENEFNFSIGQIINEKENKDMPDSSSLNEKLSDVVGNANLDINKNINLNYNFSLDQNFNDLNYNELGASFDLNPIKFDFNYLQEKKHMGDQEYVKANVNFLKGNNGALSIGTKRNLITNSAEYYDLSYEYLNDCLKAGLVYRREFYNDSELEAENSLMFKITLIPFGNINSPSFNQ